MRIIFMGTPAYAVPTLEALHEAGHEIVAVYCQPPRPAGRRGLELKPSPVQVEAKRLGLSVLSPKSLKPDAGQTAFAAHQADAAAVVAYGLLLPKQVLEAPRLGAWNGHASLLPRWRGAAPIHRAIMAGDSQTGVMIMKMDEGLDTGPVALTRTVDISRTMTTGGLHDSLAKITAELMVEAMARLERGDLPIKPQSEVGVCYAAKITKAEARVDFSRSASEVHNHVRGLAPSPGAWFELENGSRRERIKLLATDIVTTDPSGAAPGTVHDDALTVACGTGAVRLVSLQKAGGRVLQAQDFLRGTSIAPGTVIG